MLINPHLPENRAVMATIPGTRILQETLGIVGISITDPFNPLRIWTIQGLYSPIRGRALGGLRAKLYDQKGFFTFCNQRDLEVLLDVAKPDSYCPWLDADYVGPSDRGWIGLCVDEMDLIDDLYERELYVRSELPAGAVIPSGTELIRYVHDGPNNDYEERLSLLWDMDPETGFGPDPRLKTIEYRWASIDKTGSRMRDKLWNMMMMTSTNSSTY